jgi:hypothetical protein
VPVSLQHGLDLLQPVVEAFDRVPSFLETSTALGRYLVRLANICHGLAQHVIQASLQARQPNRN